LLKLLLEHLHISDITLLPFYSRIAVEYRALELCERWDLPFYSRIAERRRPAEQQKDQQPFHSIVELPKTTKGNP